MLLFFYETEVGYVDTLHPWRSVSNFFLVVCCALSTLDPSYHRGLEYEGARTRQGGGLKQQGAIIILIILVGMPRRCVLTHLHVGTALTTHMVNCESLVTVGDCESHPHCTAIMGDVCVAPGTSDRQRMFGCVSSTIASTYASTQPRNDSMSLPNPFLALS